MLYVSKVPLQTLWLSSTLRDDSQQYRDVEGIVVGREGRSIQCVIVEAEEAALRKEVKESSCTGN